MSQYALTLLLVFGALVTQATAAGLATATYLSRRKPLAWAGVAMAALVIALQHAWTLELAVRTGIYDFRQAVLAAAVAALMLGVVFGFRRSA